MTTKGRSKTRKPTANQAFTFVETKEYDSFVTPKVKKHSDYEAKLEAEKLKAGSDWNDSSKSFFDKFREGE